MNTSVILPWIISRISPGQTLFLIFFYPSIWKSPPLLHTSKASCQPSSVPLPSVRIGKGSQTVPSCRVRSKAPHNSNRLGSMLTDPDVNACWGTTQLGSAPKSALKLLFFCITATLPCAVRLATVATTLIQKVLYQGLESDKGAELQGSEVTSGRHSRWSHFRPAAESRFPKSYSSASAFVSHAIHLGFVSRSYSPCTVTIETAKLNRSWFRWEHPSRTIGAIYKKCTRCSV